MRHFIFYLVVFASMSNVSDSPVDICMLLKHIVNYTESYFYILVVKRYN